MAYPTLFLLYLPKERCRGAEASPPGVPGTDCDHLKDTQEADAADGHSPTYSVQKEEKFAAKITADLLPPKDCHCLGDPFTEEDQGVGHNRVLKDQICGP